MTVRVATPVGFEPIPQVVERARRSPRRRAVRSRSAPTRGGGDGRPRPVHRRVGEHGPGGRGEERALIFQPYQLNEALIALADPDVLVMHCMPAHRGDEIADGAIDGDARSWSIRPRTGCTRRSRCWSSCSARSRERGAVSPLVRASGERCGPGPDRTTSRASAPRRRHAPRADRRDRGVRARGPRQPFVRWTDRSQRHDVRTTRTSVRLSELRHPSLSERRDGVAGPRRRGAAARRRTARGPRPLARNRGIDDTVQLCRGPGRLAQALAIDRTFDGIDLLGDDALRLEPGTPVPDRVSR